MRCIISIAIAYIISSTAGHTVTPRRGGNGKRSFTGYLEPVLFISMLEMDVKEHVFLAWSQSFINISVTCLSRKSSRAGM
jgi:hypothetical protein